MKSVRVAAFLAALAQGAIALGLYAASGAAEVGEPPPIEGLTVAAGENSWHAENEFQLSWRPLAEIDPGPIARVAYRIRDEAGNALGTTIHTSGADEELRQVHIPNADGRDRALPGRYTIEVWFEGNHRDGPHASATLLFDDRRPATARAQSPAQWIRAGDEAVAEIEHPAGPLPASGIRGYAIVLDHGSGAVPCAGPDACTEAETDLRSGVDDDSISFGPLFEGTNVAVVVAVSGAGLRSEVAGRTALHVDGREPSVLLSGVPHSWSNHPVQLTALATDQQSGTAAAGPSGPRTSIALDGGSPVEAPGGSVTAVVRGDGSHRVAFYGRDAVGNSGETRPDSALVRIDETAPRLSFAKSQNPSEPERIEAIVADALSGASPAAGTIAVRPVGSNGQFAPLPTKVSDGELTALWDSDSYPVGSYEFRATGYDAAGNSAESGRRLDGSRMVLANPLKSATQVEFGFGGREMVWHRCRRGADGTHCHRETIAAFERRPVTRTIPYGRGVPVAGRLLSVSGAPLPGQAVELTETFAAGAASAPRTTVVRSGLDGTFLAHLPPGPSRDVEVRFAGTRLLARASGRTVRLAVRAALRFHASSATAKIGGAPVVFSGQIAHAGAAIPATGMPIELQFRIGDSPWSEFRTVQTDARGRFRYRYAFSDDDSRGVRFQFRAAAPAQPGWPYEPGSSRPISVTGR